MSPLNPQLYQALERVFGRVEVVHPGAKMVATYAPGPNGRLQKRAISPGEYYKVSCPYCNDTRLRLWISHCWGVRDWKTGTRHRWMAICYNEDCLAREDNRVDLIRRTAWYHREAGAGHVQVLTGRAEPAGKPIPLPRDFLRLDDLDENHPAREYVRARRFDPDVLARVWQVGFSHEPRLMAWSGRLVVPFFRPGEEEVWGWQGRRIVDGSLAEGPKYYTVGGFKKSHLLYGLERARKGDGPVLVCEGVTDVWRAGKDAVALLGKSASQEQMRLIRKHLRGRPLVVALDSDARDEAKQLVEDLRSWRARSLRPDSARVVRLRLPAGDDPCDLQRKELWRLARAALQRLKS